MKINEFPLELNIVKSFKKRKKIRKEYKSKHNFMLQHMVIYLMITDDKIRHYLAVKNSICIYNNPEESSTEKMQCLVIHY